MKRGKSLQRGSYGYLFVAPYFIIFFLFGLYPILYSMRLSFFKWDGYSNQVFVGLANYARLITTDKTFHKSILNTISISLVAIIFQMLVALLLAVLLNSFSHRKRSVLKAVYFFPNLVTPVSLATLFTMMFSWQNGSINNLLRSLGIIQENIHWLQSEFFARAIISFILWYQYFGYYVILFLAGIGGIDPQLNEAAELDGASRFQTFTKVTFPLLRPILNYASIVAIIGGMQIFDINYIIGGKFGDPNGATTTITSYMYVTTFNNYNSGYGAAVSYSLFIMTVAFSIIYLRMMTRKEGM